MDPPHTFSPVDIATGQTTDIIMYTLLTSDPSEIPSLCQLNKHHSRVCDSEQFQMKHAENYRDLLTPTKLINLMMRVFTHPKYTPKYKKWVSGFVRKYYDDFSALVKGLNSGSDEDKKKARKLEKKHAFSHQFADIFTLYNQGFDLTYTDKNGYTPLMIAIQLDNLDLVEKLIDLGSDPNYLPMNTQSSILDKILTGQMMFLLLSKGAEPNVQSPLHAESNPVIYLMMLATGGTIQIKANPDALNSLKLLLDAGFDPLILALDGQIFLQSIFIYFYDEMVNHLRRFSQETINNLSKMWDDVLNQAIEIALNDGEKAELLRIFLIDNMDDLGELGYQELDLQNQLTKLALESD